MHKQKREIHQSSPTAKTSTIKSLVDPEISENQTLLRENRTTEWERQIGINFLEILYWYLATLTMVFIRIFLFQR